MAGSFGLSGLRERTRRGLAAVANGRPQLATALSGMTPAPRGMIVPHDSRVVMARKQRHQGHGSLGRIRRHYSSASVAVRHPGFAPRTVGRSSVTAITLRVCKMHSLSAGVILGCETQYHRRCIDARAEESDSATVGNSKIVATVV
jgi:hypothetical protein